jgi:hypothetical protein
MEQLSLTDESKFRAWTPVRPMLGSKRIKGGQLPLGDTFEMSTVPISREATPQFRLASVLIGYEYMNLRWPRTTA